MLFSFPINGISISVKNQNIKHRILKFEIIWKKIGQVIELWNDISFSETSI